MGILVKVVQNFLRMDHIYVDMKTNHLELYTDYLMVNASGYATATGLSNMMEGEISHDQITRLLSKQEFTSKNLWKEVKSTVRQVEREDACLIFDDTIQEKQWTDENEIMCWHYDHCEGRTVKGVNLLNGCSLVKLTKLAYISL